ncbi:MAG: DUF5050 domain-containing protein [Clostridia bacterium]|nr:DUF5050 domain-containing protein [Clostridia bacterium]
MKKRKIVCALALTAFLLAGCSQVTPPDPDPTPSDLPPSAPASSTSNTTVKALNNESDCAIATTDGEWVYFSHICNYSDTYALYKHRPDGSEKQIVTQEKMMFLQVVDGWIYYVEETLGGDNRVHRMRTDGSEKQLVKSGVASYHVMAIINDTIFFDLLGLESVKTDGTQYKKLCEETCYGALITEDWIYYLIRDKETTTISYTICKMRLDGTENTVLLASAQVGSGGLQMYDGWLYFTEDGKGLYKMRPEDGSQKTKVVSIDGLSTYMIAGDTLYWSNYKDESSLNSIKLDGTQAQRFPYELVGDMDLIGDWLYFRSGDFANGTHEFNTFRINVKTQQVEQLTDVPEK